MDLGEKLRAFRSLKHDIRKKRILFDEHKDKFGFDVFTQLVKVKNTSEVKGYPFMAKKKGDQITYAFKIVPNETKYDKHKHPSMLEMLVLKQLTEQIVNKHVSPHVAYYFGDLKVSNRSRAIKFLNLKKLEAEEKIRPWSTVLVSEFVEGGSLDKWVYDKYENDETISDEEWRGLVFQLLYTIVVLQKKFRMMHNDFHYGNILVDSAISNDGFFSYHVDGKTYFVKNPGFIPKLWDFEFSMVYSNAMDTSYENKFVLGHMEYDSALHQTIEDYPDYPERLEYNVPVQYNEVYDVHYFLTSLLDLYISQELFSWILSLYPSELIPPDDGSSSGSSNSDTSSDTDSYSSSTAASSSSSTSSASSSAASSAERNEFIYDGRLINGVHESHNLPTALELLQSDFFSSFRQRPPEATDSNTMAFKC